MVSRKKYLDPNPPKVTAWGHRGTRSVAGCRNRLEAGRLVFGSHERMDGMGCDWSSSERYQASATKAQYIAGYMGGAWRAA